jgi:hypothetical protein
MGVIKRPWVIKDTAFTVVNQDTAQKQPLVLGGVIPGVKIQEDKSDSLIKKIASRTKGLYHKIFPNPVRSNATLRIEWKDSEIGEYSLQLFSFGGQLILRKEVWIDKEVGLLELQLPQVSAGTYLLRMTNKTSGRSFTEKIIVQ